MPLTAIRTAARLAAHRAPRAVAAPILTQLPTTRTRAAVAARTVAPAAWAATRGTPTWPWAGSAAPPFRQARPDWRPARVAGLGPATMRALRMRAGGGAGGGMCRSGP